MKKKTKNKLKWILWGLAAFLVVCVVMMPLWHHVPRTKWRVPVRVVMPSMDQLSKAMPDMPDIDKEDVKKLRDEVEKMLPETATKTQDTALPPYDYEPVETPRDTFEEKAQPEPDETLIEPAQGKGKIAIVIDDMGMNAGLSARAIRLPADVTLAFLPYAPRLEQQTQAALSAGHDLMLHLPMEPIGKENPGPNALLTNQSEEEWGKIINIAFKSFRGFIGVNNHMGSKFTSDTKGMEYFSKQIVERDVFFLDSRTNGVSLAEKAMQQVGVRTAVRDVFLDDMISAQNVRNELRRTEQIATRNGQAIAIGHPHAVTLEVLEQWLPQARERGFEIVRVKDLVK